MKALLRNCAAFVVLGLAAWNAQATSVTTDQSDLWYVASESGWGMQLVQRDATIFATLFVYGSDNKPTWFVSTMERTASLTWSGPLYATTGPWFGTQPFSPLNVNATQVGTMTWSAPLVEQGTVTYTVNGVSVTKTVVRETLVMDDFSGTFVGGYHASASGCNNTAANTTVETYATTTITQSGSSLSVNIAFEGGLSCSIPGNLVQFGQFGTVNGNYTCTSGEVGSFTLSEMNVGFNFWGTRMQLNSSNIGCQTTGYFGGVRHR